MKQENLLKKLREHQPIVINYGKGIITDKDIKDYATWDDEVQSYKDETGIWDIELLIDIAKGNIEEAFIEE